MRRVLKCANLSLASLNGREDRRLERTVFQTQLNLHRSQATDQLTVTAYSLFCFQLLSQENAHSYHKI